MTRRRLEEVKNRQIAIDLGNGRPVACQRACTQQWRLWSSPLALSLLESFAGLSYVLFLSIRHEKRGSSHPIIAETCAKSGQTSRYFFALSRSVRARTWCCTRAHSAALSTLVNSHHPIYLGRSNSKSAFAAHLGSRVRRNLGERHRAIPPGITTAQ